MRTFLSASTLAATATVSLLLAPAAYAMPLGDNGDVKIHDAKTGKEYDNQNQLKICSCYVNAFNFDAGHEVDWQILPDGKGTVVDSGSLVVDGDGHVRSEDISLPDGFYKLVWTFDGEKSEAKQKSFTVDCKNKKKPAEAPGYTPGEKPGYTPGEKPGYTPGEKPEEKPSPSESAPPPKPDDNEESLAETGAPVTELSVTGALLVGAGGYLVMRRRTARRQ